MGLCTDTPRALEPTLNDLAGVEFQHDLHLVVRDWAAWTAVSERLARAGANIHALRIARGGDEYNVHCRLEQISAEEARDLTSAFLDEGVAERGNVEHLVVAKRYARCTQ